MKASDPLERNFPELESEQREKLLELERLIQSWNEKVNLISRKETAILERHILPSLLPSKLSTFPDQGRILDIGTGGGLPGLPLAIVHPELHFTLLDATRKKLDAIREMARALELENVDLVHERAEKVKFQARAITGRAVTALPKFLVWCRGKLEKIPKDEKGGIFYWTGGAIEDDLKRIRGTVEVHSMTEYLDEPSLDTKKLLRIIPH